MNLLELAGVTMEFGGLTALSGVSFPVVPGDVLGLIGPNGAGKTTLFNLVTALFPPTGGDILFEGESLRGLSTHQIAKRGIVRTFQNIRLFPQMTVEENVLVGRHVKSRAGVARSVLRTKGQREEEARLLARTNELLRLVGLEGANRAVAASLPYGHQRRAEIARALASDPKLLLLDEPAAGMNESETEDIRRLIDTVRGLGITVILIEHDMSLVMKVCNRLVVLSFGQKIAEGTPGEIQNDPAVVEAYLGREEDDDRA